MVFIGETVSCTVSLGQRGDPGQLSWAEHRCALFADTFCHSSHPTATKRKKKMGTDEKVFASSSPHLFAASSQSTAMRKKRFKRYKRTKNKKNIRLCMLTSNWNLRRQISFLLPFLSPHFFVCSARHVFFLAMGYGNLEMPECYRTGNCYTILFGCLSEMK